MTKENEDQKKKTPLSQSAVEGIVIPDCPDCNGPLFLIANSKLDGSMENILACDKCRKAFRGLLESVKG